MKVLSEKSDLTNLEIVALLSSLGMTAWIITDFIGRMIIYFIAYSVIILPIILLYIVSVVDTLISMVRDGRKTSQIKILAHSLVIITIALSWMATSELFKSDRVLTATLRDDLYHFTLVLRENGTCEVSVLGMFGYSEVYKGAYQLKGDSILFLGKALRKQFYS